VVFTILEDTFKNPDGGWILGNNGKPIIDDIRAWTRKGATIFRKYTRLRAEIDVKYDITMATSAANIDWDFHGNGEERGVIMFGRVRSYSILFHEMAHIFIMRRIDAWLSKVKVATVKNVFGEPEKTHVYSSPRVDALIRQFDGPDAYIQVDMEWPYHYWPYMLSGSTDYFEGAEIRSVRILQAFYDDLMES